MRRWAVVEELIAALSGLDSDGDGLLVICWSYGGIFGACWGMRSDVDATIIVYVR